MQLVYRASAIMAMRQDPDRGPKMTITLTIVDHFTVTIADQGERIMTTTIIKISFINSFSMVQRYLYQSKL